MTEDTDLLQLVEETLSLLAPYEPAIGARARTGEPLDSLLSQCRQEVARLEAAPAPPLRMIHHFACTGGTLVARALACQPNTMVLSELDPFSELLLPMEAFTPSDLILHARRDRSPPPVAVVGEMFEAALSRLLAATAREGRDLVLREHTHSHFCAQSDPASRPTMGAFLGKAFPLRQLITVRHPLDSYLSLVKNGWTHGMTGTLEGYARCYLDFLDAYPGVALRYYEHFAEDPDGECRAMTEILELDFHPRWQDVLPVIQLSGDSGRKSFRIAPRPRRPVPEDVLDVLSKGCPDYEALCRRLGYDPAPDGPAMPAV